ncbi:hypothetical protein AcW2_004812 [Taiwanofungus camphoratus]|nr:hypothetical protein AcW2_004812 [Antrodia cinnamomea]
MVQKLEESIPEGMACDVRTFPHITPCVSRREVKVGLYALSEEQNSITGLASVVARVYRVYSDEHVQSETYSVQILTPLSLVFKVAFICVACNLTWAPSHLHRALEVFREGSWHVNRKMS